MGIAPPSLPPACAGCRTLTQSAAGITSGQSLSNLTRAGDGKMRIDSGAISIITNPKAAHTIVLDHIAKEARLLPAPPQAPGAQIPGMPQMGAAAAMAGPGSPAMKAESLGKSLIAGHEAQGMRYVIPPPPVPGMPAAAGGAQLKMAQASGMHPPAAAQMATTAEVWTSTKLGLPLLTKVSGPFGQLVCQCKPAPAAEPHPSLFQIPAGYKSIAPPGGMPKL